MHDESTRASGEDQVAPVERKRSNGSLARFKQGDPPTGFVYFIEAPAVECVKIGFAGTDPLDRLEDLQPGSPVWLELIAVVEAKARRERWIHHRLVSYRLRNEWFGVSPLVRQVIDAAIGMMRPDNAAWCLGGEEYGRWDYRRKSASVAIEEARNPLEARGSTLSELSPIDILTGDMDAVLYPYDDDPWGMIADPLGVRWMVPDPSEMTVEPFRFNATIEPRIPRRRKVSRSGGPSRKPKPGHFSLIDQYRAERKAAKSNP